MAFERIYRHREEDSLAANTPEARNAIAHALIAILPVYTFDEEARDYAARLSALTRCCFQEGGRRLAFPATERETITRLAIRASGMPDTIERLQGLQGGLSKTSNIAISQPLKPAPVIDITAAALFAGLALLSMSVITIVSSAVIACRLTLRSCSTELRPCLLTLHVVAPSVTW